MNELIREALTDIGDNTRPPVPDMLEFQRRVRIARRRRNSGRAAIAVGAAAMVGAVAVVSTTFLGGGGPTPGGFASTTAPAPIVGPHAVWYTAEGKLFAAYDGTVVAPGLGAEQVLGSTRDGVWYVDRKSNVRWARASSHDGVLTVEAAPGPPGYDEPPVTGAVSSAAVSADGKYLAWVTLSEELVVWSVGAREVTHREQLTPGNRLHGVGARGALIEENRTLRVAGRTEIDLPLQEVLAANMAGDRIAVRQRVDAVEKTQVYELGDTGAALVETVPGSAWLAPDGLTLVTLPGEESPSPATVTPDGGAPKDLGELAARASSLQFTPDGTVLLGSFLPDTPKLLECVLASAKCEPVLTGKGETSIWLAIPYL